MWLLNTKTAKLQEFNAPKDVRYAILSHVWDEHENSFQDLQKLHDRCAPLRDVNPRDHVCPKIRRCCELAASEGFEWVWIDTCCIDKTNSTDLSEAINSMFRYYTLAEVCYAYLRDVSDIVSASCLEPSASPFSRSAWHKRGWTLQELIAPSFVVFLNSDWDVIGSKVDNAQELSEATGIPATLLRLEKHVSEFSVAQRMSWAATRKTSREEDMAYCLMGIFDVNMPIIYGEGAKAFQRLQEEIMKRSVDTTLLAWGESCTLTTLLEDDNACGEAEGSPVFASSPSSFCDSAKVVYIEGRSNGRNEASRPTLDDIPMFTSTPHGLVMRVPLVESQGLTCADLSWFLADGRQHVYLILDALPCASTSRRSYCVGRLLGGRRLVRLLTVPHEMDTTGTAVVTRAREEILLVSRSRMDWLAESLPSIPLNSSLLVPFRFPHANISGFLEQLRLLRLEARLAKVENVAVPWAGNSPARFHFSFVDESITEDLIVEIGTRSEPGSTLEPTAGLRKGQVQVSAELVPCNSVISRSPAAFSTTPGESVTIPLVFSSRRRVVYHLELFLREPTSATAKALCILFIDIKENRRKRQADDSSNPVRRSKPACVRCYTAKKKCSGGVPCDRCIMAGCGSECTERQRVGQGGVPDLGTPQRPTLALAVSSAETLFSCGTNDAQQDMHHSNPQ